QPPRGGAEVKRQDDVKPQTERDAGLADQNQAATDAQQAAAEIEPAPAEKPADEKPGTRMVGGGRAVQDVEPQGDTALAEAVGKMERVREGDAPGVLFDRMNRAEGQPRAAKNGKNW